MVAGAAAVRQKISAELRPDITLKVNGQVQELEKDAISYQGSTYLPVRAVGEAMGMEVDWKQDPDRLPERRLEGR